MIPMKHSSIFRSRWMALLWAAGILWLAYDVASLGNEAPGDNHQAAAEDVTGAPVSNAQVEQLESIIANM